MTKLNTVNQMVREFEKVCCVQATSHVAEYYAHRYSKCRSSFFKNMHDYYARLCWGYSR